jgi:hypothetical protein
MDDLALEPTTDTRGAASRTITCVRCGGQIRADWLAPRMCCPHCGAIGFPDRAGHNLLTLDWDCPACGAPNDGRTNFCMNCGAGLSSRCLRCEAAVYTAVCGQCGAHQAHELTFREVEEQRTEWLAMVQAQRAEAERLAAEARRQQQMHNPDYGVTEWRTIDQGWREVAGQRAARYQPRRSRRGKALALLMILVGAGWLISQLVSLLPPGTIDAWLRAAGDAIMTAWDWAVAMTPAVWTWVNQWWAAFTERLQTLERNDPEYAYLFGTLVFGLALLPVGLYLIGRLLRRWFP